MPNQISWITKNLGSRFNSDLFKKKICPNPSTNCKVMAVQKWLPFSKNNKKLLSETVQTCPIWTNFFLNRSELNLLFSKLLDVKSNISKHLHSAVFTWLKRGGGGVVTGTMTAITVTRTKTHEIHNWPII